MSVSVQLIQVSQPSHKQLLLYSFFPVQAVYDILLCIQHTFTLVNVADDIVDAGGDVPDILLAHWIGGC